MRLFASKFRVCPVSLGKRLEARFKGRCEKPTGIQETYIERECKVILSALTSVGYIGYYIVRCILVHGARVQKKAATFPLRGRGREGMGAEDFL